MRIQPESFSMTILLAFMTALGPVTMDIYLASLPHIGEMLSAPTSQVQLTLSFYVVGFAIGQIFYGPMSDAIGRRPMLLAGFAIYILATIICIFARSIEVLIGARLLQALGAGGPIIVARAMVRDLYSGSAAARQLSMMSAIMGVAPIGAPILGGFLQGAFGWQASFVAMGAIGTILAIIAWFFLPETNLKKHGWSAFSPLEVVRSFGIVASNRSYQAYIAMMAITYAGVFAFLSSSSHILQKVFSLTSEEFGFAFAACSLSYILGNSSGTKLTPKLRLKGMMKLGAIVTLIGGLSQCVAYFIFPDSFLAIIIPQMIFFVGNGFLVPQLMAAALTPFPERAGAAASLMGFLQMTTASILGAVLGLFLADTAWPLVCAVAISATMCFVVYTVSKNVRERVHGDTQS